MSADPIKGKSLRWKYSDGPVKGRAFEHHFTDDGTVSWNEASDGQPSAGAKPTGAGHDSSARYEVARLNDDVYVVSYLAGSGYTLTTVVDERTGKIISFASNEKELTIQHGELVPAKERVASR
jgi:hypothetical protein